MDQLPTKTIEEVTQTLIDYRGKTPPKTTSGVKLITAKVIKEGFIQDGNHEYIAEEMYDSWMRRGLPKQWDILITTEAPLGEVAQIRTDEKVALAQRVILLRGNPEIINQRYYFHVLKSPLVQGRLKARATGTTVFGIKQKELRKVQIPLFSLPVQEKIGEILSAYDDLIDNNNRRIALLEEAIHRLYREWFVHLRFPGHEHTPVVDGVPQGWEKRPLAEVCHLTMGQSPKSEFYNTHGEGLPFHQGVKDFGTRFITHNTWCTQPNRIAEAGDILFSVRAPVGRINVASDKLIIGRGLAAIRNKLNFQSFLLYQLKNQFFKEDMIGGGAIFASVTKKQLSQQLLLVPSGKVLEDFERIAAPADQQIANLSTQNIKLAEARDALLPRLMNGSLPV